MAPEDSPTPSDSSGAVVIRAGEWTDEDWESYIRDASIENTILERGKRWYQFQQECRRRSSKQGGSRFGEFAKERFGYSAALASHWATIGANAEELCSIATKFSPDWTAFYEWTLLTPSKKATLLSSGDVISRNSIKAIAYGHQGDEGDEWYTPRWLFDSLALTFSIDVCAPLDRTRAACPAKKYYTSEDDGIAKPWKGTIWCNPPYSDPSPWAHKCIAHGDGLLLTHIPMNAEWASAVWQACDAIRLFQSIEFVRPDGQVQRPGSWLQLTAFGETAVNALSNMIIPDDVKINSRRVPSPMWVKADGSR